MYVFQINKTSDHFNFSVVYIHTLCKQENNAQSFFLLIWVYIAIYLIKIRFHSNFQFLLKVFLLGSLENIGKNEKKFSYSKKKLHHMDKFI